MNKPLNLPNRTKQRARELAAERMNTILRKFHDFKALCRRYRLDYPHQQQMDKWLPMMFETVIHLGCNAESFEMWPETQQQKQADRIGRMIAFGTPAMRKKAEKEAEAILAKRDIVCG